MIIHPVEKINLKINCRYCSLEISLDAKTKGIPIIRDHKVNAGKRGKKTPKINKVVAEPVVTLIIPSW
jgi:hypothetical protein